MAFATTGIDERRVAILSHPLAIGCLICWFVNDWVLKARFGNAVTGKLSDVCAMVVFPLLLAVVFDRFVVRPMGWAVFVTAVFFSGINLFEPVDHATESALRVLRLPSGLTMDPTDLAVLPIMFLAVRLWNLPTASFSVSRRQLGRGLFALGALTTMATSDVDESRTSELYGTVVLTEDNPTMTLEFEYRDKGDEKDSTIGTWIEVTAYGTGPPGSRSATRDSVAKSTSDSSVSYRLTDPSWAPVEVSWSIWADQLNGETCTGPGPDCVLIVDAPADEFVQNPDVLFSLPQREVGELMVAEVVIRFDQTNPPLLVFPDKQAPAATTMEARREARDGRIQPVPAPPDCVDSCEVSIWLSYRSPNEFGQYGFVGEVELVEIRGHELVEVRASELVISSLPETSEVWERWEICLEAELSISNLVDEATIFADARTSFAPVDETILLYPQPVSASQQPCHAYTSFTPNAPGEIIGKTDVVRVAGAVWTIAEHEPDKVELAVTKP